MEDDGTEVEVYTAAEVQEQIKAKEDEFGKTKAQIEAERDEARTALGERTNEIRGFRKLNDDVVKKLSVAERTIYENGLLLQEEKEKREADDKKRIDAQTDASIRARVGTDETLFKKIKDMWSVFGINATTPEEIDTKTKMIIGAIGTTEPNLVAKVNGFSGGSFVPPKAGGDDKSFADTERGAQGAAELGLKLKPDEKK